MQMQMMNARPRLASRGGEAPGPSNGRTSRLGIHPARLQQQGQQQRRNLPRSVACAAATAALSFGSGGDGAGRNGGSGGNGDRRPRGDGGGGKGRNNIVNIALIAGIVLAERVVAHRDEQGEEERVVELLSDVEKMLERHDPLPGRIVLFVEPSPFTYVSGYNTRFRNTIRQLRELGCEVLVITTGKGFSLPGVDFYAGVDPPAEYAGAKVMGAFSFGCPAYWQVPLSFALEPRIFNEVRKFNADLIHCTSPGAMCFAAWLYAKVLNKPLIYSYHTHVPAYLPKYNLQWLSGAVWGAIRAFHQNANLTIAASATLGGELVAEGAAPAHSVKTWKKAVDGELFHPRWRSEEMRARLSGGRPEAPLMVYVGRVGAEKNIEFLAEVLARNPEARLGVVGDGPARAHLEAHFAAAGAGGRVTFLGTLRGAELSAAYASGDVFVMPSETETLGFVVLEAMSSGLPVVAVAAGGIPDIVTRHGRNGFLYQPGDADAAGRLVRGLLASSRLRESIGVAAREETNKWGWAAATQNMLEHQYPLAVALHALDRGARERGVWLRANAWERAAQLAAKAVSLRLAARGSGRAARVGSVAKRVAAAVA